MSDIKVPRRKDQFLAQLPASTGDAPSRGTDVLNRTAIQRAWILPGAVYLVLAWTFTSIYYFILPKDLVESVQVLSAFQAKQPMQLRVLIPAVIHFVTSIAPISVTALDRYILLASIWSILMLFAVFLRGYISRSASWVAAPMILVPLIWNNCLLTPFHYPSDMPAIAFFLACLVLWREKKYKWYYLCFLAACFNRETILFVFPCLMALHWSQYKKSAWLYHAVLHVAIFGVVRVILWKTFENSPGIPVVDQLGKNMNLLTDLFLLRNGAPHFFLVLFGGMHILALALVRWAPRPMKWLALVTIPYWAGMFYAGIFQETRIFSELAPIYTAIVITVVAHHWPRVNGERADFRDRSAREEN